MATEAPSNGENINPNGNENNNSNTESKDSTFECNICLEPAAEPVITMCGHLFCWSCIYQWIANQERPCPVCKSVVSKEKLIPLYGRGKEQKDPRNNIPERPPGQRTEPINQPQMNFFNPFGATWHTDNFAFSAGVGFPSLFGLQFHTFPPMPRQGQELTPEQMNNQFLSRVMFMMGCLTIVCLLYF